MNLKLLFSIALFSVPMMALSAEPGPKFGSVAKRLFESHEYIRKNAARDFWALIPYYVPQQDSGACSVASVVMVINGVRASKNLTASDELALQKTILDKADNEEWKKALGDKGVSLDRLGKALTSALKAYGYGDAAVEIVHVDTSVKSKDLLHKALVANEKSANDFIVANFLQSAFTGDPEGAVGHIAPVAAYDEKNKRVLILDPDRQYYEPYWVSEETFLKGMATEDKDTPMKPNRGYAWVKLAKPAH